MSTIHTNLIGARATLKPGERTGHAVVQGTIAAVYLSATTHTPLFLVVLDGPGPENLSTPAPEGGELIEVAVGRIMRVSYGSARRRPLHQHHRGFRGGNDVGL